VPDECNEQKGETSSATERATPGPEHFRALYSELGFISPLDEPQPLHLSCEHRSACWEGSEHRFPPENDWSHIYRPWVGPKYAENRILVVAVNMNADGGFDEAADLVEAARKEIRDGKIRIRFGNEFNTYPGTFLYHRMGCYASAIVNASGTTLTASDDDSRPSKEVIADAFDYFAYTNHVKCSPDDTHNSDVGTGEKGKSEPTAEMWSHCGPHVLAKEIALLHPKTILILGTSDNWQSFANRVLISVSTQQARVGSVRMVDAKVNDRDVRAIIVPHPQARGGNAWQIYDDLRSLMRQTAGS
jgi:hypothetical protein